jgi:predicted metal-dependent phosphoesterase TrpH
VTWVATCARPCKRVKVEGSLEAIKAELAYATTAIQASEKKSTEERQQIDTVTQERADIQAELDRERVANEENVAGRAAEAAIKKRHERDLAIINKVWPCPATPKP